MVKEYWCVVSQKTVVFSKFYYSSNVGWTTDKDLRDRVTREEAYRIAGKFLGTHVVHLTVKKVPKKFKPGDKVWVKAKFEYMASHCAERQDVYVRVYNTTNATGIERIPLTDVKRRKA